MSSARQRDLISVDDYLAGEAEAEIKHEYIAGIVYAMAGGTVAHNMIATNILRSLGNSLVDQPCREFNSDMKVRVRTASGTRFYYPDAQVVCNSNPQSDVFQDQPVFVFEVLSDSTRRADEGEKKESYFSVPSIKAYVTIEQDEPFVTVYRRGDNGFTRVAYAAPNSVIELTDPDLELTFQDMYRDVQFG